MYHITKVLNHNTVLGRKDGTEGEYLIVGKGIGFGKKTNDSINLCGKETVYPIQEPESIVYLEIANEVLDEAEKVFHKIDRSILFPLSDHIAYAVKRMKKKEPISNPLTDDIRILFYKEYKVAEIVNPIVRKYVGVEMDSDEIGYVALHIHSAIQEETVSTAMQVARAVRTCINIVEKTVGKPIDVQSLSYNRLMNHVRNMVARAMLHETLKLNINDYMSIKFPQAFETASHICDEISNMFQMQLNDAEVGYLAMHIERITDDEEKGEN